MRSADGERLEVEDSMMTNNNTSFLVRLYRFRRGSERNDNRISAGDRATRVRALVDRAGRMISLRRHMFRLGEGWRRSRESVRPKRRLIKQGWPGFIPARLLRDMNEDGTMARMPNLKNLPKSSGLK
jgi:hypothetical protein